MKKNTLIKLTFLVLWLSLIAVVAIQLWQSGLPLTAYPQLVASKVTQFGIWSPIVFILLFAVRPLIFFPATILSLSAGLLFGPYKALLILIVAENLSSLISYSIGRYLGSSLFNKAEEQHAFLKKFSNRLHKNEFLTILTLRLLFAPFDLLGYFAGINKVSYPTFAVATAIGILPGLTTSAFLSGSFYNPLYLGIAAVFFLLSFGISKYIQKTKELSQ